MCVCVCVCVWLNKFYNFYIAAVVSIASRRGLRIEVHNKNQPIIYVAPRIYNVEESILFQCGVSKMTEEQQNELGSDMTGCQCLLLKYQITPQT